MPSTFTLIRIMERPFYTGEHGRTRENKMPPDGNGWSLFRDVTARAGGKSLGDGAGVERSVVMLLTRQSQVYAN